MPTGYTAIITEREGVTFQQFTLRCARAFGPLIHMRDDDMDEPLRYSDPKADGDNYYAGRLMEAKADLERLQAMSPDEGLARGVEARAETIQRYKGYLATYVRENQLYDDMADQVAAWKPPTPDHIPLQTFMLEQIRTSRHQTKYTEETIREAEARDPATHLQDEITETKRLIKYYTAELRKRLDKQNAFDSNGWIDQLCESLGVPTPKKPCPKK